MKGEEGTNWEEEGTQPAGLERGQDGAMGVTE